MSVMFVGPLLDLEYLMFLNKLGLFKNTLHKQMTSDEDAWCDEIAIDPVLNTEFSVSRPSLHVWSVHTCHTPLCNLKIC